MLGSRAARSNRPRSLARGSGGRYRRCGLTFITSNGTGKMYPGKCALYLALLMAALLVTASVGAHVRSAPPPVQDQFFCTADPPLDSAALCASLRRNLPETRGFEALKRYGPLLSPLAE